MLSLQYHDQTKHHFDRFARSLGYLDWATQPDPFRRYPGAPVVSLPRTPLRAGLPYTALFDGSAPPAPLDDAHVAEFLRCSMGLSAWKQYGNSRWSLRVNPSSGNLHPTETYVIVGGRVWHYAPRDHAVEERAVLGGDAWQTYAGGRSGFLVALSSIHWREAWKYGERAFRYCQHDIGHALGALRFAAALCGWRLALLPRWSDRDIAAVCGLDRGDSDGAEPEEPECVAVVAPGDVEPWRGADPAPLVAAARAVEWRGRANVLSRGHVEWPIIGRVAEATRYPGLPPAPARPEGRVRLVRDRALASEDRLGSEGHPSVPRARTIMLQRRSALGFDARSTLPRARWRSMLDRLVPGVPPGDALDWPPHVHLVLFVHRVSDLTPGVYVYLRERGVRDELGAAMRSEFLWEPVDDAGAEEGRLFLLLPADVTWVAARLSCDQDIAADGFFSVAMLARFEPALRGRGEWFYRRLFWECGLIGQILYLDAEAAGARGTGIGCFYDDPVHEALGLSGHAWQSLYHFAMGAPVDDARLTTEPGYDWEKAS